METSSLTPLTPTRVINITETLRENRELKWKLKTLGRQLGKAGERIHTLRCEPDSARVLAHVDPRGYHANLERMREAEAKVIELTRRIKELENPDPAATVAADTVEPF